MWLIQEISEINADKNWKVIQDGGKVINSMDININTILPMSITN